jgi:hypothetical protein
MPPSISGPDGTTTQSPPPATHRQQNGSPITRISTHIERPNAR